jgi:cytochrome c-type biogenesis protein CcmF
MRARQSMLRESPPRALARLVSKNPRRYGGYVVHIGVVMIFVGVAASSLFQIEKQVTLKAGETTEVGAYTLRYGGTRTGEDAHKAYLAATVDVHRGEKLVGTLHPEKRFYKKQEQPSTEPAIRGTVREDLYVILGSYEAESALATFQIYVNPMVFWIWFGGLVLVLGTMVSMYPNPAERRALALAREAEKVGGEVVVRP